MMLSIWWLYRWSKFWNYRVLALSYSSPVPGWPVLWFWAPSGNISWLSWGCAAQHLCPFHGVAHSVHNFFPKDVPFPWRFTRPTRLYAGKASEIPILLLWQFWYSYMTTSICSEIICWVKSLPPTLKDSADIAPHCGSWWCFHSGKSPFHPAECPTTISTTGPNAQGTRDQYVGWICTHFVVFGQRINHLGNR